MPNKYEHFIAISRASLSTNVVNFYLGIDRIAYNEDHPFLEIDSYTYQYDEDNKTHTVDMVLKEVTPSNSGNLYPDRGNPEIIFSENKSQVRGVKYILNLTGITRLGTTDPSEYAESKLEPDPLVYDEMPIEDPVEKEESIDEKKPS